MTPSSSTRLLLLALITFVLFLSTLVGTPVLPQLAAELGADSGATAAVLSAALSALVVMQFFAGGLADRYGRKGIPGGAADAVPMPARPGLTAELSEGRQGAFDAAVDLLMVISPAIALAVYAQIGRVSPLLLGAGLLSPTSFPVALMVKETRVKASDPDRQPKAASRGLAACAGREGADG